jgi:hypothetical protein
MSPALGLLFVKTRLNKSSAVVRINNPVAANKAKQTAPEQSDLSGFS